MMCSKKYPVDIKKRATIAQKWRFAGGPMVARHCMLTKLSITTLLCCEMPHDQHNCGRLLSELADKR